VEEEDDDSNNATTATTATEEVDEEDAATTDATTAATATVEGADAKEEEEEEAPPVPPAKEEEEEEAQEPGIGGDDVAAVIDPPAAAAVIDPPAAAAAAAADDVAADVPPPAAAAPSKVGEEEAEPRPPPPKKKAPAADASPSPAAVPAKKGPSPPAAAAPPAGVPTATTAATAIAPAAATDRRGPAVDGDDGDATTAVEERGAVSASFVGRVIGKGGEMIRDLQARSGCRIDVDQNVPAGAPRIVTYKGTRSSIDFAKQLVSLLCTERGGKEAELPLGQASTKSLQIPGNVIGKIIGRGGEMIRRLQNESGAKIQVDHSVGQDANHRQVTITGDQVAIDRAEEMMMFLCANPAMDSGQALEMLIREKQSRMMGMGGGGGVGMGMGGPGSYGQQQPMMTGQAYGMGGAGGPSPQAAMLPPGGNPYGSSSAAGAGVGAVGGIETEIFPCSKIFMGRIIGQRGITINDLQKRSGCDIQTKQNVPAGQDCQISIKGSRRGIDSAKQMLREIIDMGPNHPYAGGREFLFSTGFLSVSFLSPLADRRFFSLRPSLAKQMAAAWVAAAAVAADIRASNSSSNNNPTSSSNSMPTPIRITNPRDVLTEDSNP
jgi:far upstream element-binding protein